MARILADGQWLTAPQVTHSMDRQNFGERQPFRERRRMGLGAGLYSLLAPRQIEFGLRIVF